MSTPAIVIVLIFIIAVAFLVRQGRNKSPATGTTGDTKPGKKQPGEKREGLLNALDNQLKAHKLDHIAIQPLGHTPAQPWSSKFGGQAYWPKAMDYPVSGNGHKLYLLAQLNLSEMPALPGYPDKGLLQFFITDDDLMGLCLESGQQDAVKKSAGHRVIYHEQVHQDPELLNTDVPHTRDAETFPISGEYAITFARESGLPACTDYRFEHIGIDISSLPDEVVDEMYDRYDASGSRVGGYANFTQDDPRSGQPHDAWLLLFQMDSSYDKSVEIMWGDCGVGNFFIQPEALAKRDFSNVWFNWDCS